jgi:hypothetical protein
MLQAKGNTRGYQATSETLGLSLTEKRNAWPDHQLKQITFTQVIKGHITRTCSKKDKDARKRKIKKLQDLHHEYLDNEVDHAVEWDRLSLFAFFSSCTTIDKSNCLLWVQ